MASREAGTEHRARGTARLPLCAVRFALRILAIFLTASALIPASAHADWPIVMPPFETSEVEGEWGWLSVGLPDAAKTKLHSALLMRGITEDDILEAAARSPEIASDAIAAARHFNSQLVIYGTYRVADDLLEVSARCVDPVTGQDLATFNSRGPSHDPSMAMDPILLEIARNLRVDLDRESIDGMREPLTAVVDAFKAHALGLQELQRALAAHPAKKDALERAAKHFKEASDLDPGYADPVFRLAEVDARLGRKKEAESGYRAALKIDRLHADARYRLGLLYRDESRMAEAMTELEQALKQAPEDPRVQMAFSSLWFDQYSSTFKEMETRYRAAIDADPDDLDARYELGSVYEELKRPDDARKQFEAIVARNPGHADANYKLGLLDRLAGNKAAAASRLQTAADGGTQFGRVHFYLGEQLSRLGRDAEAAKSFTKATQTEPNFSPAFYELGRAQARLGNRPQALQMFQKYSELSERDPRPYVDVARIYLAMTLYPQALAALNRAYEIDPAFPDYHVGMGELYEQQGRTIKAGFEYGEALRIDPDHPRAEELKEKVAKYKPAEAGAIRR